MVKITIFIEGGTPLNRDEPARTVGNTIVMRESFHQLFIQKVPEDKFNLNIEPHGGYKNTAGVFKSKAPNNKNAVILLDFAEPSDDLQKAIRTGIAKYSTLSFDKTNLGIFREECVTELGLDGYQERVFFMDREMEAWILSQPEKIENYGTNEGFIRKQPENTISDHALLNVNHPRLIEDPKTALNTIFQQFFDQKKRKSEKLTAKKYDGGKDGPKLIAMLDLNKLMETFSDAKNLVNWILNTPYVLIIFNQKILTTREI